MGLRARYTQPEGRSVRALLWGPRGAGKTFLARAMFAPLVTIEIDVPWLLSGNPAQVAGRVEDIIRVVDGSKRALLLERLDVGVQGVDPEVLRRFAHQVRRIRVPTLGTAEEPDLPWPFDRVFEDVHWLPNNRRRRAAAWRHHLAGRATDMVCDEAGLQAATMRQIGRAATALKGDELAVSNLLDTLSEVFGEDEYQR